jgi:hypothetical protein
MKRLLPLILLATTANAEWKFVREEIDAKVGIGYGIVIADVNGDGKPDILLADKDRNVWYENPTWKIHVLTGKLTPEDHVCLAARDIDGDGKAEIASGAGWNPGDTVNSGAVFFLEPGQDRNATWTAQVLPHQPTVHRMYWVKGKAAKWGLVVAPLHPNGSLKSKNPGSRIEWYSPPDDKGKAWDISLIDNSLQRSHNVDPINWDEDEEEELLLGGLEGVLLADRQGDTWKIQPLFGKRSGDGDHEGVGEVRAGQNADGTRFIATIEPMHGHQLVIYQSKDATSWERSVVKSDLLQGHAVACAKMGRGQGQQVVFGWRGNGKPGDSTGLMLYDPAAMGPEALHLVDKDDMSCEDVRLADLDGDGLTDIVASGRATNNVVIYWNKSSWQ